MSDHFTGASGRKSAWSFGLSIFLGAWLVFQIQPVISKLILPWYGGSPNVWNVCLLFFQTLLFCGYSFAFLLSRFVPIRGQVATYVICLIVAALVSPIRPSPAFKPTGLEDPAGHILQLLAYHIGAPYLLLCATGPLLQDWFRRTHPGVSPYRLYALSNAGSLLGLLTYPFVIELLIPASQQANLWYWSFVAFVTSIAVCGAGVLQRARPEVVGETRLAVGDRPRVAFGTRVMWFLLALLPTLLLPAITGRLTQDVGGLPFLWIAPLTIYLVSLIWCFSSEKAYSRNVWGPAFVLTVLIVTGCMVGLRTRFTQSLPTLLLGLLSLYFTICMVCHGELSHLKPDPSRLTEFYLVMSAGGAIGGILSGLVAPLTLNVNVEYHLGLLGVYLTLLAVCYRDPKSRFHGILSHRPAWYGASFLLLGMVALLTVDFRRTFHAAIAVKRNFYGVLRVEYLQSPGATYGSRLELVHGDIRHGAQFTAPEFRKIRTTYYDDQSGVGLAITNLRPGEPRRIGLIGMGTATLAAYGTELDEIDFFEINPAVLDIADTLFTFRADCPSRQRDFVGDARLTLERLEPQGYDLLVVDAFSGDAIPIHLLTREAFEIYFRHLKPEGILAIHITNSFFDLEPVLHAHVRDLNLSSVMIDRNKDESRTITQSNWVLLSRDARVLANPVFQNRGNRRNPKNLVWTDENSSPLPLLRLLN
ncbi:spermidine synthase [Planctomicrobium sp. SH664]|uniref:spermidine synthase n=1 Tax=Planctomicrobium sp. SH664 TaxID=3448125 RepID=UPI003F5C4FFD